MATLTRILLGLATAALGYFVVWKAEDIRYILGESSWAEKNMGGMGGTRGAIKLAGIVILFLGFAITVDLGNDIARGIAGLVMPGK